MGKEEITSNKNPDAGTINIVLAEGTDLTNLVANFTLSPNAQGATVNGTRQTSEQTANDFTSPVIYTVIAEDGSTKDWTITVTTSSQQPDPTPEPSDNAHLSNLTVGGGYELSPTFTESQKDYTVNVPFSTDKINLTATTSDANATITINGTSATNGTAHEVTGLTVGNNPIPVVITAADGTTTATYTVTVNRAAPGAPDVTITTPKNGTCLNTNRPDITGETTANDGATVQVTIGNNTYSTTAQDGAWTVTVEDDLTDGQHTANVTVTDHGAEGTATTTFTVLTGKPVITLLGEAEVRITSGENYSDAGATAVDAIGGDITSNIVTTGNNFDTSVPGVYGVTYNVQDAAGNSADAVTRSVTVMPNQVTIESPEPGKIKVTDATPGSEVILYDEDGHEIDRGIADDNGEYIFDDVPPGNGYEVTQKENGVESTPSNKVDVQPEPVTITSPNPGVIEVTGASPGNEVTLYDKDGNVIDTAIADENGTVTFENVDPGEDYYVTQKENGVESAPSNKVDVQPDPVSITSPNPGVIEVTGATPGNEVTLYDKDGNVIDTAIADQDGNATFENVDPGEDYYVTQKENGVESALSNKVDVQPDPVTITTPNPGVIEVTGATPGNEVTLYDKDGNVIDTAIADENGTVTFENVDPGQDYTVTQTKNGVESAPSNKVDVQPEPVSITSPNPGVIEVTGATPGNEVTLYDKDGNVIDTAIADENGTATFENVDPGQDYYVTQKENGVESAPSNKVDVQPEPVSITTPNPGVIEVTGATPGNEVTLYDKDGNVIDTAIADENGTATFENVDPGQDYTVTQTENGVESAPSNKVDVQPEPVTITTPNPGVIEVTGATPGNEVTLYDKDGNVIDTAIADENGTATFENVDPG
ncbi:SpaA isopeptide-forming pilin-related protein, partial [Evansella tamaricis]